MNVLKFSYIKSRKKLFPAYVTTFCILCNKDFIRKYFSAGHCNCFDGNTEIYNRLCSCVGHKLPEHLTVASPMRSLLVLVYSLSVHCETEPSLPLQLTM